MKRAPLGALFAVRPACLPSRWVERNPIALGQAKKHQEIAIQILEEDLGLTVNRTKTHITSLSEGVFYLGFVIYPKCITIHPKRVKRFKDAVRRLTPRNHGKNVEQLVADLNRFLRGWIPTSQLQNLPSGSHGMDTQKTAHEEDAGMEKLERSAQNTTPTGLPW